MIWDCFIFYNELELLELRLMELEDVVDVFVLGEATTTFTAKPKPLIYGENKDRFERWNHRIIHVVYDDPPKASQPSWVADAWDNEYAQRNNLVNGLRGANDDDVILLSDVDEIPHPDMIPLTLDHKPVGFKQQLYYYYVNCLQNQGWIGTRAIRRGNLRFPLQHLREHKRHQFGNVIIPGGWHFSFLGGTDRIVEKIKAYAETTTNKDEFTDAEHVEWCRESGADLFDRQGAMFQKQFVRVGDGHPKRIHEWLAKYPEMAK